MAQDMRLSRDEFAAHLAAGALEIGLTLTARQIDRFFFTCANYRSGIGKSISPGAMMICS
jgi:hypothetical protein